MTKITQEVSRRLTELRMSGMPMKECARLLRINPGSLAQHLLRRASTSARQAPANDNHPNRMTRWSIVNGGCSTQCELVPVTVVRTLVPANDNRADIEAGQIVNDYALSKAVA